MSKKVDWFVGYYPCLGPFGFRNSYTIGMAKYGHLEFQMLLNMHTDMIKYTLNTLGCRVRDGEVFVEGQIITDLFDGANARLDKAVEGGRPVLRVIIPDPQFRWPEDPLCEEPYKYQTIAVFEDGSDYSCQKCANASTCDNKRRH